MIALRLCFWYDRDKKFMKKRPDPPVLGEGTFLIDSHCHLDMEAYGDDPGPAIAAAAAAGVTGIITIGIDLASSQRAIELAGRYRSVHATVGIHPHSAVEADEAALDELADLCCAPKVVGLGEIGLDYAKQYAPVDVQQRAFGAQLELAKTVALPVIIHDREAHADTMAILREHGPFPAGGVMHCFSGDLDLADQVLALGFYISIPGIVTFKNATELQRVATELPLEKIILETDGPFLAPVPWRGKTNQPAYLTYTAQQVAELKNISIDEVAQATSRNCMELFSLSMEATA
jgi:TatD DNase family protein